MARARAFSAEHAPDGVGLDDLSVLGPITLLKLKAAVDGYTRPLVAALRFFSKQLADAGRG